MKKNKTAAHRTDRLEDADVPSSFYWKTGSRQDIGSRREQQDSCGVASGVYRGAPALIAVLADGMGGMNNGAEFSRITLDHHRKHFQHALDSGSDPAGILLSLAFGANREANAIYDEEHPGGTTLVSAFFTGDLVYTLSIGDSRICLFRKVDSVRRFVPLQLNREHVLGHSLDERAWMGLISHEDASDNFYRQSLTSSIGGPSVRRVDLPDGPIRLIGGDRIVLMSDGIYRSISGEEMAAFMEAGPEEASDAIVRRVIEKKLPHQDNMSIVIIEKKARTDPYGK